MLVDRAAAKRVVHATDRATALYNTRRSSMRSLLLLSTATALAVAACTGATGGVQGGEPLAVDPCQVSLQQSGAGHRWQDLYACYFGPTGKASCASQGVCHGAPDQAGAAYSSFVCGPSKDACWQGMISSLVPPQGATDGTKTILYFSLRKQNGTASAAMGNMPCSPVTMPADDGGTKVTCSLSAGANYAFTADDLARIVAWVQEGAQDN